MPLLSSLSQQHLNSKPRPWATRLAEQQAKAMGDTFGKLEAPDDQPSIKLALAISNSKAVNSALADLFYGDAVQFRLVRADSNYRNSRSRSYEVRVDP
eukprot:2948543-Pleurochrysis_carterae.AAC.1